MVKTVDITQLSRELLPRRVDFARAKRPDSGPQRPRHVRILNQRRMMALAAEEAEPEEQAGLWGLGLVPPEGYDDDDPYYATPEAVLCAPGRVAPQEWAAAAGAGVGLSNLGNTCFANSVLQCLAHLAPLAGTFAKVKAQKGSVFDPVDALAEVVRSIRTPGRQAYSPGVIVRNLRTILPRRAFRQGEQADAHEFAVKLLDACQVSLVKRLAAGRKLTLLAEATTPLMRVIGGYVRSQVRWTREAELKQLRRARSPHTADVAALSPDSPRLASNTYELSTMLHLPLAGSQLDDCMRKFCEADPIDGYKTPRGAEVTVRRGSALHIPPRVLMVELKRFTNRMRKIDRPVRIPMVWEVAAFTTEMGRRHYSTRYQLSGVVVHLGQSLNCGHYIAYVRAPNGTWQLADDDHVRSVGEDVLQQHIARGAYMLFYTRLDAAAPKRAVPKRGHSAPAMPSPADEDEDGTVLTEEQVLAFQRQREEAQEAQEAAEQARPSPKASPRVRAATPKAAPKATPKHKPQGMGKAVPANDDEDEEDEGPMEIPAVPSRDVLNGVNRGAQPASDSDEEIGDAGPAEPTPVPRGRAQPAGPVRGHDAIGALKQQAAANTTKRQAYHGSFKQPTKDSLYEQELDKGHVNRGAKRKEKRRERSASAHRGRNVFQEETNIRARRRLE